MENYTNIQECMEIIRDVFEDEIDFDRLCQRLGITPQEFDEIESGELVPNKEQLDNIFNYCYNHGLYLNEIKWEERLDEHRDENGNVRVLVHGSRQGIKGEIRLNANGDGETGKGNDFSDGFYLGESLAMPSMFVGEEPNSTLYIFTFDTSDLRVARFSVSLDWMLAVAWYRGLIPQYAEHPRIKTIREKVNHCDYVLAPIADNKMFELLQLYIDGEITDQQCLYAMSATHLGYQYVLKSQKALDHLTMLDHLYFCSVQKSIYNKESDVESNTSITKAAIAKKRYAGQGKTIDELLGNGKLVEECISRSKLTEETLDNSIYLFRGESDANYSQQVETNQKSRFYSYEISEYLSKFGDVYVYELLNDKKILDYDDSVFEFCQEYDLMDRQVPLLKSLYKIDTLRDTDGMDLHDEYHSYQIVATDYLENETSYDGIVWYEYVDDLNYQIQIWNPSIVRKLDRDEAENIILSLADKYPNSVYADKKHDEVFDADEFWRLGESLLKLGVNDSYKELVPHHIEYWYDRISRCWVVQVMDENNFEIENEYSGNKESRDYSIQQFANEYGLKDIRKI